MATKPETTADSLTAALARAQAEMTNAPLNKVNPHFKSKYADLAAIRDAVVPALTKHGLAVTQTMEFRDGAFLLVTTLRHTGGETVESVFPLPANASPQQAGSAITYGKRYSLAAICGIAAEEDDDGNAAQDAPRAAAPARPASQPTAPRAREPEPAPEKMEPIKLHKSGSIGWPDWGRAYADQIKLVDTAEELAEWRKLNSDMMADCYKEAPRIHERLTQLLDEADARVGAESDPFPAPAASPEQDPAEYLRAG